MEEDAGRSEASADTALTRTALRPAAVRELHTAVCSVRKQYRTGQETRTLYRALFKLTGTDLCLTGNPKDLKSPLLLTQSASQTEE